jgi:signal transduction histidine kinase
MSRNKEPYYYARAIAWFSWLTVGVFKFALHRPGATTPSDWLWFCGFVAFGPTLYARTSDLQHSLWTGSPHIRLGLATISALVMVYADPLSFACALLVIIAWEVAIALPLRVAMPWILTQTFAVTVLLTRTLPFKSVVPEVAIYLGFQGYAVITAHVARSEAAARVALVGAHAELKATQTILTHSARAGERLRIARELHDLLGHHLSALVMNLEVARHTNDRAMAQIVKSQELARLLLTDVRSIVKLMRDEDRIDLTLLLERMADDFPQINMHWTVAQDIGVTDPQRIQVVIRVLQEAVTNSISHSGCTNLWIDVVANDDGLEIRARDDGCGARHFNRGNGLRGMQERLEELGGRLTIDPEATPGFLVIATVPRASGGP